MQDSADVMALIAATRDSGVDLAIRGGGDGVPGFGTVDDGLVIDLSHTRRVRVDPAERVRDHLLPAVCPVALHAVGNWPDPAGNAANTKWLRDYYAAIRPHSSSEANCITLVSGDDDHRAAGDYGARYERPSAVKAAYDPVNLFRVKPEHHSGNGE